MNCYIWGIALYGAKTSTLLKVDQKYLGSSETWCWRRTEISWSDLVGNEEVLQRVKEERKVPRAIKMKKCDWFGQILRRNCLLTHLISEMIEGMGRRGIRGKQLLDNIKRTRRYLTLKEDVLDRRVRGNSLSKILCSPRKTQ
jgi:hypothetical protein